MSAKQELDIHLRAFLGSLGRSARLAVAYSGGPDSQALLCGLVRASLVYPDCELRALHVDHGLHSQANAWSRHCQQTCARLGIALKVTRVDARPPRAQSPEEAARRARYAALSDALIEGEQLVLAHNAEDQTETLLLRLLRGAGPEGLAAMRPCRPLGGTWLHRPLLTWRKATLRTYLDAIGESYVLDPSNHDPRFDRSFLRNNVLPGIRQRWPGLDRTIARAADIQARTAELLADSAADDLSRLQGSVADTLSCAALVALQQDSDARARNALRGWLRARGLRLPSAAVLARVFAEMLPARPDASPCVPCDGAEIRRYRGNLYLVPGKARIPSAWASPWHPPERLSLPHGELQVDAVLGEGLSPARLAGEVLLVRSRKGGETCRLPGRSGTRQIKKLLQERGVPPWERPALPFVFVGSTLAAIAGVCVCDGFEAQAGETGWRLRWKPIFGNFGDRQNHLP